jgi:GT2 family glycosyltransferase
MIDVLAICTRNRPLDLERCLESVRHQAHAPRYVFVVDGSSDLLSKHITERFTRELTSSEVKYLRSEERGLVMARNVALNSLPENASVVHFIDDDTELEPEYLSEINLALLSKDGNVGAGGRVLAPGVAPNRLLDFWHLSKQSFGRVLPSGFNIGAHACSSPLNVEWLPGCSMSFVVDRIKGLEFDVRRSTWPMGEDVDFGLKASSRGKLVYVPTARIVHNLSPVNRDEEATVMFQDVVHRWTLAKDRLGRVSRPSVFISTVVLAFSYSILAVVKLENRYLNLARSAAKGLWVSMVSGGLQASR